MDFFSIISAIDSFLWGPPLIILLVVTGDMTQKDLPRDTVSGLEVATKVLSKVEEIAFIKLTNKDVVRHPLVQKIVKAYEDYEENQAKAAKRREARKGSQTGRRKN